VRETETNLIRDLIVKRLMKTLPVIKIKPGSKTLAKFGLRAERMKVNVVVFKRPPQPSIKILS